MGYIECFRVIMIEYLFPTTSDKNSIEFQSDSIGFNRSFNQDSLANRTYLLIFLDSLWKSKTQITVHLP